MGQAHRRRRLQAFRSHGLAALLRQVAQPASYPTPPRNSPVGPVTKKNEPLLTFKRGAPVHFAVSQYEVAMTTRLAGEARVLLPFNRGTTDGGAVNDTPADVYRHATDYRIDTERGGSTWASLGVAM